MTDLGPPRKRHGERQIRVSRHTESVPYIHEQGSRAIVGNRDERTKRISTRFRILVAKQRGQRE